MIRLLYIEFLKVKSSRYFWIFSILFLLLLLSIPIGSKSFVDYLALQGEKMMGVSFDKLPFFDFVDIWQNMAYLYKFVTIVAGFVVVISVANEYRYGTVKQNVIDGLSRKEFLLSKIYFILAQSLVICLFIFLIGLWVGFQWSAVTDAKFIFKNIEFLFAYYLVLVGFQLFCLFITLLIKKSGIVILLLLFYFYVIEGFSYAWISYNWGLPEYTSFFPFRGMANILSNPFPKYVFQEVHTSVQYSDLIITLLHIGLYTGLSFWFFHKKDIR